MTGCWVPSLGGWGGGHSVKRKALSSVGRHREVKVVASQVTGKLPEDTQPRKVGLGSHLHKAGGRQWRKRQQKEGQHLG